MASDLKAGNGPVRPAGIFKEPPLAPPSLPPLWSRHARKGLWAAGTLAMLAGLAWLAWEWRQLDRDQKLAENAARFYAAGDFRSTVLSARQALQLNPRNIQAIRLMVQLASRLRSPEEVLWRSWLAEVEPLPENQLALAAAALAHQEPAVAEQALAAIPSEARNSLNYHRVAGALALAQRLSRVAEMHFQQAAELAPDDAQNQLNLAAVQLLSSNLAVRTAGRQTLAELARRPELELAACQSLLNDAKREGNTNRVLELAARLAQRAPERFDFQIEWLEALRLARSPESDARLIRLEETARQSVEQASLLIKWLNAQGSPERSLAFSRQLSEEIRLTQPVPLVVAEALIILKDWRELETHLAAREWGGLEFVRAALLARVAAEQERWEKVRSEWNRALRETQDSLTRQFMLGRLMEGWGWRSHAAEVWWQIARGDRGQRTALEHLFRIHRQEGKTRQLWEVTRRIRELAPNDPIALHNEALLGLLLGHDAAACLEQARTAHRQLGNDASAAATLALALKQAGQPAAALALLDGLPPAQRELPALAGYYGMVLLACGQPQQALPWLEKGLTATNLLPEERDWMAADLGRARAATTR